MFAAAAAVAALVVGRVLSALRARIVAERLMVWAVGFVILMLGRGMTPARGVASGASLRLLTAGGVGRGVGIGRASSIAPGAPGGAPMAKSSFASSETRPSSTPLSPTPTVSV